MAEGAQKAGTLVPFRDQLPRELAIARIAERQHRVITLGQLCGLGLSASAVRKRAAVGRLFRLYRGVYAIGTPRLDERGRWMAAVLAYGDRAVLSHRSAAAQLGLLPTRRSRIDVCVPRRGGGGHPGIDLHRTGTLLARDVVVVDGIPCTSVARTLVDLGDVVAGRRVERAVEQAEILRVFDLAEVEEALQRAGPRRGAGVLREVLSFGDGGTPTNSELEERFLRIVRTARLPKPAVNEWVAVDGHEMQVDFLWAQQRLIVEVDGHETHRTRQAFERDRLRDQRLTLAGWTVVRFTHRQVTDEAGRTVSALLGR